MTEHTIGRRQMIRGAGIAAGGVAVTSVALASPAMAGDNGNGGLTGSWLITRQDNPPSQNTGPVLAVLSFAIGGVVIAHDINPAGPPFTGTWTQRGDNGFRATFYTGFPGNQGPGSPGVYVKVQTTGRVHDGTISGTYTVSVFDANGNPLPDQTTTGSFTGTRIQA